MTLLEAHRADMRASRAVSHGPVATATLRPVVAVTGLAGSGKSAAARRLVLVHGFARMRFAGPLRAMLYTLGLTEEHTDGKLKELPCALLGGRSPRHAMQTLGTEWGRNCMGADFWIRAWRANVDRMPSGLPVVVDDLRFPNEAAAIQDMGGFIIRVERPAAAALAGTALAAHASEAHVDSLPCDAIIENAGTIDDLHESVRRVWDGLRVSRKTAGFGGAFAEAAIP